MTEYNISTENEVYNLAVILFEDNTEEFEPSETPAMQVRSAEKSRASLRRLRKFRCPNTSEARVNTSRREEKLADNIAINLLPRKKRQNRFIKALEASQGRSTMADIHHELCDEEAYNQDSRFLHGVNAYESVNDGYHYGSTSAEEIEEMIRREEEKEASQAYLDEGDYWEGDPDFFSGAGVYKNELPAETLANSSYGAGNDEETGGAIADIFAEAQNAGNGCKKIERHIPEGESDPRRLYASPVASNQELEMLGAPASAFFQRMRLDGEIYQAAPHCLLGKGNRFK